MNDKITILKIIDSEKPFASKFKIKNYALVFEIEEIDKKLLELKFEKLIFNEKNLYKCTWKGKCAIEQNTLNPFKKSIYWI